MLGFDVDIEPDNFADHKPVALVPNEHGVVAIPTPGVMEARIKEEDPTLAPPMAKKPRLEAKTTVTTLHPVSELTQKHQGAMFEFAGRAVCVYVYVCE